VVHVLVAGERVELVVHLVEPEARDRRRAGHDDEAGGARRVEDREPGRRDRAHRVAADDCRRQPDRIHEPGDAAHALGLLIEGAGRPPQARRRGAIDNEGRRATPAHRVGV
jgi:hypothetical protein